MISLEAFEQRGGGASTDHAGAPDRDAPAVVLLTSGTTSRPKAVVHSLNTLTAGTRNMASITATDEHTTTFLVSPLASITGVMQMHLVADQHATLVLEDTFDPDASLDRLNEADATLLGGAPVIAERLLRAAEQRATPQITLRTLAVGGSMLPRPILELATDAFGIEIVRVYGSSEAPNFTGSTLNDDRERRLSDDGALMPGSEVRVGSSRHPQEGMLRGPSLFLGYTAAEHQAAAFEDGWFRTNDLVDLHDGRLTVVGRLGAVANRNGLKISLDEVEAALAGMPGVVEHACFALPDPATGERLAVVVHAADGATITLESVVEHLLAQGTARRKLPEELVLWDEPLPRTPSGKIVRRRGWSSTRRSSVRSGRTGDVARGQAIDVCFNYRGVATTPARRSGPSIPVAPSASGWPCAPPAQRRLIANSELTGASGLWDVDELVWNSVARRGHARCPGRRESAAAQLYGAPVTERVPILAT